MQVAHPYPQLLIVVGQLLGHPLGQGGHQYPVTFCHGQPYLMQQIIHLACSPFFSGGRADGDRRIHQTGGADHLLHKDAIGLLQFIVSRCGRDMHHLIDSGLILLKVERPVIQGGRQPETELNQGLLTAAVTPVHPPYL